jgi:serine/threonine-protein kinase
VLVDPEVPTLHKVQFGATTKTGVEVRSQMDGLNLYLDGKLVGQLPQRVTGLSTGEHVLLVTGGEDYYAEERKIDLDADELMVLDDIQLTPKAGTLRIAARPELEGATVLLDGEPITVPFSKQLQTNRRYRVQARRTGYEDFEAWVELDAGHRTKDLDIQLIAKAPAGLTHASNAQASRSNAEPESGARRKEGRSSGEEGAAQARLNLLSEPPSMVLLNGKPLGQTPRRGVTVNAGTHAVLFIHPTLGRARASAKLEAGQAKTLKARF